MVNAYCFMKHLVASTAFFSHRSRTRDALYLVVYEFGEIQR